MNTQITNTLSDAQLELVSGGCYKREESYECDGCESDDYGCDEYESKGCEDGSYSEDSNYGSCHKRRNRRRHHNSCSW